MISGQESVYFEYPSDGSSDETIIMIHGYRGNHHGLEAIAGGLTGFRVLIPDLPGFGESMELPGKHNLDTYATWLRGFVDTLGLSGSAHIVGHSFGTLVVGLYASSNRCKSVVMINPVSAPALSGPRGLLTRVTSAFYHMSTSLPEKIGSWLLRSSIVVMTMSVVMAKTNDKKLRRWIHRQHLDNFSDFASVRVASEAYDASISSNLGLMAPTIQSPVLIVAAELDDITDLSIQRSVATTYPNSRIAVIEGVGHLVHYEAPLRAAGLISEFIERAV